ncbi:kinase-like protein [Dendrothele bispora CBS 962.96]|uniref:Kinase-like protein n=1 Tax=Dendrothele bispora (strain CBS 962.96) TaxID=1314807 RepID=A0A4S8LGP1_DENBC|nr:kinase-like protein [Dendrothele bispora CBS 962.96]
MPVVRHRQKPTVAAVANHDRRNWGSRHTGPTPVVPQAFPEPNVSTYRPFLDVQQPAEISRESERPSGDHASLLARIETILGNPTEYRELLAQRGEVAQSLLDLLQTLYDYPGVLPRLRSKILHAMLRLSDKSGLYPNCLALDNDIKVGNYPLTAGGFGEIWKGLIGGQMACLKVVKIYSDSDVQKLLKEFRREAILWRQLNHPNVLPFLGLYFLDSRICLISPWIEMGNLRQYLYKHEKGPIDYFNLAFDIACGLSYLHKEKVVHGDLKGDNILITNLGRAAIADFGLARKVFESDTLRFTSLSTSHHGGGSMRWLAPECLLEDKVHTYQSDIYAFGCVCYEVFTGLVPFHEFKEVAVINHLSKGHRPSRPANSRLNDNMWAIMQECWRQEPDSRPPTNTLSGRIVSAANRKTINLGSNWDDSLPSLLRRSIRYPEICPGGSLVDAFLFGPRYQSTNLEQTHSLETEWSASSEQCPMAESSENLVSYREMLLLHADDEPWEMRSAAVKAIDEILHRRGQLHLIVGQPLYPEKKIAPRLVGILPTELPKSWLPNNALHSVPEQPLSAQPIAGSSQIAAGQTAPNYPVRITAGPFRVPDAPTPTQTSVKRPPSLNSLIPTGKKARHGNVQPESPTAISYDIQQAQQLTLEAMPEFYGYHNISDSWHNLMAQYR